MLLKEVNRLINRDTVLTEINKLVNSKFVEKNNNLIFSCIKYNKEKKHILFESVKKFGTPQYILYEKKLIRNARFFMSTFKKYIPTAEFYYAFKSNDLPYLIKVLKNNGYNADVAGLFELQLALHLGFNKIIFTGPGKSKEELELAIKHKDKVVLNIDNEDELKRLIKITKKKKVRVSIRINSDDKITKLWGKFGIPINQLVKVMDLINNSKVIILSGLHFHSSWNLSPERYVNNIKIIGNGIKNISKKHLSKLSFFDVGGGFAPEWEGALFKSSIAGKIDDILIEIGKKKNYSFDPYDYYFEKPQKLEKFAKQISDALKSYILKYLKDNILIYFEPGRYLSKNSTAILAKVIAIKQKGIIIDAGSNILGDDALYGWEFTPIINISNPSYKINKEIVYGSLCDPTDIFGYRYFGEKCKIGDILLIPNQGAYTFSWSRRFIKPIPRYVIQCKNNTLYLAKERETFKDRYSGCKV